MRKLPKRQVHLDFHTGPHIPEVGESFSKEAFIDAIRTGHIDSITVFAKCHHGLCYYPTSCGIPHPGMRKGRDLTGEMIEAAHAAGAAAPVYITVGWSEAEAERFPDSIVKDKDGNRVGATPEDTSLDRPYYMWQSLCPSGSYAEHIYRHAEEVCRRYQDIDGLFFDIVYMNETCYCNNCVREMREAGLDPYDEAENKKHYIEVHRRFAARCREILFSYNPEATIFFNSGGAEIYRPEYHPDQTHFEMEDLPTAWGGYDRFVPRASYMSRYGKDYLGMTGKFHAAWGEFGGYKNADALKYELAVMGMYGAGCSVGDQLHPSGVPDPATYRLIGEGYSFYEAYEPWFFGARDMARVGVYLSRDDKSDAGLHKMLLERHIDFAVVHPRDELSRYDALILPDSVQLSDEETEKLRAFSGLVLLTGGSMLQNGVSRLDCGAECVGQSPYDIDYIKATGVPLWIDSPFLCVEPSIRLSLTDGESLADVYEPYFRRTHAHFCSHRNTPYKPEKSGYAAIVKKKNVIRFAHPLCRMYEAEGVQLYRDLFINTLLAFYTPSCAVTLPSAGRVHLTEQASKGRYVLHLAYAQPIARGSYSVIEDTPTLSDIAVTLRLPKRVKSVHEVNGDMLPFTEADGVLRFTLPRLTIYTAVELLF